MGESYYQATLKERLNATFFWVCCSPCYFALLGDDDEDFIRDYNEYDDLERYLDASETESRQLHWQVPSQASTRTGTTIDADEEGSVNILAEALGMNPSVDAGSNIFELDDEDDTI